MAGRQTYRVLIVGKSGGGKSTLARELIQGMAGRYEHLVIINRKRELSDLCDRAYTVYEAADAEEALVHPRVFLQVTGYDPRPFLDNLGRALMRRRGVLIVIDEAHQFFPTGQVPRGLFEVLTGGREQGHNLIFVTQMLKGHIGGIDPGVRRQITHLVTFRLTEPAEVAEMAAMFPELGERVTSLLRPDPVTGAPPEYAVKNLDHDSAGIVLRTSKGREWRPLT